MSYILYLDCNNLYGWALSQPLLIGEFLNYSLLSSRSCDNNLNSEKLSYKPSDFTQDFVLNLDDNGEYGYTFIVNLEIPVGLHNKFKDYPMLPEHYIPKEEELSWYQRELIAKDIGSKPKEGKLITTLYSKKRLYY